MNHLPPDRDRRADVAPPSSTPRLIPRSEHAQGGGRLSGKNVIAERGELLGVCESESEIGDPSLVPSHHHSTDAGAGRASVGRRRP